MERANTASAFLRRLHPWLGRAVHTRWSLRRSFYQREMDALLMALQTHDGHLSPDLKLRLEGLLGRLYRLNNDLQKAEGEKSSSGKTYGELLKAGTLPGGN